MATDVEVALGGCTEKIADSVGLYDETYYITGG